jgi:hypothetical protein
MHLPPFESSGDLPVGVHTAALSEVTERFGQGSPQRFLMGQRLERIYRIAQSTGQVARFIVFGSFVTSKPEPNDVDVFMLMEDTFDSSQLTSEVSPLFDHNAAQAHFGASVFWLRRLAAWEEEESTVQYWKVKRSGQERGIVEIIGEAA